MATDQKITVSVNGTDMVLESGSHLGILANKLRLPEKGVAIALEREIVPKALWESTKLLSGQQVEVVSIAAGG